MLEMPKGTVREDGYRYWGSYKRARKDGSHYICQTWVRPEIYELRQEKNKGRYGRWYRAQREAQSDNYLKTKETNKQRMAALWVDTPKKAMVYMAKHRAKKAGIPFNICADDFEIPEVCPLLGIPLIRGIGSMTMNSPELDRIIPSLGYVKGNVWVISRRANTIKSDATIEEIRLLVANWPF